MNAFQNGFKLEKLFQLFRANVVKDRAGSDYKKALCVYEAPKKDNKKALMKRKEVAERENHEFPLNVCGQPELFPLSGVPKEHVISRTVRIYHLSRHVMQAGTDNTHSWRMEFDTRKRWENSCMGWTSSGDPLSNMAIDFKTEKGAIAFCEKQGWRWFSGEGPRPIKKALRPGPYGNNFSWNKRSRVSTK